MSERLEAYGRRIVVRPERAKERSAGGLHLPAQAQNAPQRGEIVDVGMWVDDGGELAPGDIVVYSKYAGVALEVEGESLLVLAEGDILGRIRSD